MQRNRILAARQELLKRFHRGNHAIFHRRFHRKNSGRGVRGKNNDVSRMIGNMQCRARRDEPFPPLPRDEALTGSGERPAAVGRTETLFGE